MGLIIMVKLLLLIPVLLLTACNPMDYGVRFEAKDIKELCTIAKGTLDDSSLQIGVTKGLLGDSIVITQTCVRKE